MRIALIGLGSWGLNIVRSLPRDGELVGVLSQRPDAATLLPAGCRVVTEMGQLEALSVDGVIIASEASKHMAILRELWSRERGMPVFIEKPVGTSLADVESLARESTTRGNLTFLVDHVQLFNANLQAVRSQLAAAPTLIEGSEGNDGPFRDDCNALWDYGPHAVAIALYLSDVPAGPAVVEDARLESDGKAAGISIDLRLGARCIARLRVGNDAPHKVRRYAVRAPGGVQHVFDGLAPCEPPPLSAALGAFCGAIRAGRPPEDDVRWGWALPLAVTRVLDDVEQVLVRRGTPIG